FVSRNVDIQVRAVYQLDGRSFGLGQSPGAQRIERCAVANLAVPRVGDDVVSYFDSRADGQEILYRGAGCVGALLQIGERGGWSTAADVGDKLIASREVGFTWREIHRLAWDEKMPRSSAADARRAAKGRTHGTGGRQIQCRGDGYHFGANHSSARHR